MIKKVFSIILVLVVIASLITGCAGQAKTQNSAKNAKDSITIALSTDVASLDPFYSASDPDEFVFMNIYDTLLTCDDDNNVKPHVAKSWTVSDDGLTYVFKIRDDIMFHNGEKLTAEDVAYSINRAKQSPYKKINVALVDSAVTTGDYEVTVKLSQPFAPFLIGLAKSISIFNQKAVEAAGDKYAMNPVGTGAYKFVSHATGQNVKLVANDDYFLGAPPIKNVTFKVITDANSAKIALETGDVNLATVLPTSALDELKKNDKLTTIQKDSLRTSYVTMNLEKKPFNDPKFRQALSYAVDKNTMIAIARDGLAFPAYSIISKYYFGYTEDLKKYEYDTAKAKALLAECGYPNGVDIGALKTYKDNSKTAEVLQSSLKDIGVTSNIELEEYNAYYEDLSKGNYGIAATDVTFYGDASKTELCYGTSNINGLNRARYTNPKVDGLYKLAKTTMDPNKRLDYYKQIFNTVADEAIYIPLYSWKEVVACTKGLKIEALSPARMMKVNSMSWEK